MTPVISMAGLTRRYRGQLALDRVTLDVEEGSITGLLGRNGAGKTTMLRILAGQEFPSAVRRSWSCATPGSCAGGILSRGAGSEFTLDGLPAKADDTRGHRAP